MSESIQVLASLVIPLEEISFRTSRSKGPGGQHVNRTESKVELCFNVANSPSLSDAQRDRILEKLSAFLDQEGVLHLTAQTHRSQFQNKQAALRRFQALLQTALKPEKKRKPTRPSKASVERRLKSKQRQSEKKRLRKRPDHEA